MRTRSAVKSGAVPVRPRYVERSAFDMIGSRKPVKLAGGCPLDGGVRAHGVRRKPRFGVCPDRRALPLEVTACDDERKCSLHKWALTFDMSGRPLSTLPTLCAEDKKNAAHDDRCDSSPDRNVDRLLLLRRKFEGAKLDDGRVFRVAERAIDEAQGPGYDEDDGDDSHSAHISVCACGLSLQAAPR